MARIARLVAHFLLRRQRLFGDLPQRFDVARLVDR
jgi:hypothetical protein